MNFHGIKFNIHKKGDKKSSAEKLKELKEEEQLETISNILRNTQTCLNCKNDTYLVVDTEKTNNLISHICLCTSCMDTLKIDMIRGLYTTQSVSDIV